ncbi:MAG: endonuclease domain-containing protein [Firmicutes bacterium]|nr:endonuclease domain-containing protein [Bacillota bacterium]MDY5530648.1 endonuclease domain-containing protein [Pumilibacteraceae bacterium]
MKTSNKKLVPVARILRNNMTKEERHIWYDYLRPHPVRFARQKIIGSYVVDFYCAEAKLIIEIDGSQHYEEAAMIADEKRTAYLNGRGFRVIRFSNADVNKNFNGVCESIDSALKLLPKTIENN